jgi:hypothetical protein
VLVEQRFEQRLARAGFAFRERIEVLREAFRIARENLFQRRVVARLERLPLDDLLRDSRHRAEILGLLHEPIEVIIAIWIQQTQPREMSSQPELRRRGREQPGVRWPSCSTSAYSGLTCSGDQAR